MISQVSSKGDSEHPNLVPVANTHISISGMDARTGAIDEVAAVCERRRGLVALRGPGSPRQLLRPRLEVDSKQVELTDTFSLDLVADCWPRLEANVAGIQITITVACPAHWRGFLYHVALRSPQQVKAKLVLEVKVAQAMLTFLRSRAIGHGLYCAVDPAERWAMLEADGDGDLVAAAFTTASSDATICVQQEGVKQAVSESMETSLPNDGSEHIGFLFEFPCNLEPGTTREVSLMCGVAPERYGARSTALAMRQYTPERLLAEAQQEAHRLLSRLPALSPNAESRIGARYRQNALFCYHFATVDALDTGATMAVSSRSSHSPLCCATIERETLMWALPVLTWLNPNRARDLLLYLCQHHNTQRGGAVHYPDGVLLAPEFQLDQLCAYPIALSRFITTTGDQSLVQHAAVRHALQNVREALDQHRHRDSALYSTELGPDGKPAVAPYVTYCNVLAWRAFIDLGWITGESRHRDHAIAEEIRRSIHEDLVDPKGQKFLYASDLNGEVTFGDNSAGSLFWLPILGFCPPQDPIFQNTAQALTADKKSGQPWSHLPKSRHGGVATATLPPSLFGASPEETLRLIADAPLDGGLMCCSIDPTTGRSNQDSHHATAAGLLAWALAESRVLC